MLIDSKSGVTQKEKYNSFENNRKQAFLRNASQVKAYFDCKLKASDLPPHEVWEDIFHSYMQACENIHAGKPAALHRILEELNFTLLYSHVSIECSTEFVCEQFDNLVVANKPTDIWKAMREENIPEMHRAINHGAHITSKGPLNDKSLLKEACSMSENVFYTLLSFRER